MLFIFLSPQIFAGNQGNHQDFEKSKIYIYIEKKIEKKLWKKKIFFVNCHGNNSASNATYFFNLLQMPPSTSICVNWHVKLICVKWHPFQSASNAMHKKCVKCHAKSDLRQKPPCVKFLCVKGPCVKSHPICLSNKVPASKFRGTKAICVKRPSPMKWDEQFQNISLRDWK